MRFIPACAGNATSIGCRRWPPPVHPRVCGERYDLPPPLGTGDGSSPRVRGTHLCRLAGGQRIRFIPACAGNALATSSLAPAPPVHPRVCGEREGLIAAIAIIAGSSPRVRGTHRGIHLDGIFHRFIPACAGNASTPWRNAAAITVHPRVCGERGMLGKIELPIGGSSPRVRGTRH